VLALFTSSAPEVRESSLWAASGQRCAALQSTEINSPCARVTGAVPVAQPTWMRSAVLLMQEDDAPPAPPPVKEAEKKPEVAAPPAPPGFEWGESF